MTRSAVPAIVEKAGRWQRLKALVGGALELPVSARASYLSQQCEGDLELYQEATSLLELELPAAGFIDDSPVRVDNSGEPLAPGTRLGQYRVLESLGSGGMGDVYLAERADGEFEHRVAIKLIRARGLLAGEILERFLGERQLLAELNHPNIAHLIDGGTDGDGRPFLVMELVEGEPIDRYCERQGLSVEAKLRLFLHVCDAVQHAHQRLLVHRDLKPANVMVTEEGIPKLLDFGVAKDLGGGKTPRTRLLVPVTPEYASPEQLTGGLVTTATDVYALGVILYELLTETNPFDSSDPLAGRSRAVPPRPPSTAVRHLETSRARRVRRRLSGDLDHVVLRALAPDPSERYASVEQFGRDIGRHLRGLPLETRDGRVYRLGKLARRHWKSLAAMAIVVVLGAALIQEILDRRQLQRETRRVSEVSVVLGEYLGDLFQQADPERSGERTETLARMLDHGAELLASGAFVDEPLVRAELLGAIGQVNRRQGRLQEAEALQRESLEIRRRWLPPVHEDLVVACNNLALTLRDRGHYAEVETLLLEVSRLLEQLHSGDHRDKASLRNNLAAVEKDLGRFERAVAHYREALEMKRRLGFGPRDIAKAIKSLGTGLLAAGRLDDAEVTLRDALRHLSKLEEPDPLLQAGIEHYLGVLLRARGDPGGSRRLLEKALETRTNLYDHPSTHPKVLETTLDLALVDQLEGQLETAEARVRRVVDTRRKYLGSAHPDTAEALVQLARLLVDKGQSTAASAAAQEALESFQKNLPADHRKTTDTQKLLASLR